LNSQYSVFFAVIKRVILRILFFTFLLVAFSDIASAQQSDYSELFGEDWNKAVTWEQENRNWMEPVLAKNHISYPLAVSIIFPELVRYSALRDKMEISLLKTLYVNLGEEYADFSIGVFQMKPSFAETIRDESTAFLGRRSGIVFKNTTDYDDIKDFRKSIIRDLEDPEGQVAYLISFIRICEKKFNMSRYSETARIKFLASAYNFSIDKTALQIEKMADKKFFSINMLKTEKYSYSDISLFWYKKYMSLKH
jgi:hypothetical protein